MEEEGFHSITGQPEMAEPSNSNTLAKDTQTPAAATPSTSIPTLLPVSSTSSIPTAKKLYNTQTTSATSSPKPSRESSPVRPSLKTASNNRSNGRPRRNSSKDVSPSRGASTNTSTPLSAAALQRGLSAGTTPQLHPSVSDPGIKAPVPQKPLPTTEQKEVPRWPVSPRLRSPPPVNKHLSGPRKAESDVPAIHVQKSTPTAESQQDDTEGEETLAIPGARNATRGASGASSTLETVQEISQPNTPALGIDGAVESTEDGSKTATEQDNVMEQSFTKSMKSKGSTGTNESESEGGGKGEIKMRATSAAAPGPAVNRANVAPPSKSFSGSATTSSRGKPSGEGSSKNMTVETETVSSIPQVAVGGGAGGPGNNGSLRTKPSSETIRPKKDKKKTTRKAPSVASGTGEPLVSSTPRRKLHHHHSVRDLHSAAASLGSESAGLLTTQRFGSTSISKPIDLRRPSATVIAVSNMLTTQPRPVSSKADIFEAKIASAVDEANSSDSEETFVYESNPPDVNDRPRRFHSRTPSATSMASQVDQRGNPRSMHGVADSGHSVAMKKSMKFANSFNNGTDPANGEDDGKGTARSTVGTGRGTTHHHHIGRWGRNGGNGHQSLFDNESPFPNVAKSKITSNGNGSRNSSRPNSPRAQGKMSSNGKKMQPGYDIDDGAGADDERTPLMGSTIRPARSLRNRRLPLSLRQLEHQRAHQPSFLNRCVGCLVLSIMILLVVLGAIAFVFATTQPLSEVEIVALKKVLASEQEIMLDMEVVARNPNVVVIAVDSMDVKVFAKSKHVGSDQDWWKRPQIDPQISDRSKRSQRRALVRKEVDVTSNLHIRDDPYDDPPLDDDDPSETNTLLLGHLYTFDSPLLFDGAPFKHTHSYATGSVSLAKPGNDTEAGGVERWERLLKYEFELILRGVLRYQLPMSQRIRSIAVDGKVTVKPNAELGKEEDEKEDGEGKGDVHIA
jgi:hypothetical protein